MERRQTMDRTADGRIGRRTFARLAAGGALALVAGQAFGATEEEALHDYVPDSQDTTPRLLRRVSGLKTRHWQDHFSSVANDCILCDVRDRVLHYWGSDGFYRIYPTSVPLTEEMTRRGRTTITLKRPDPDWRPTPAMLRAQPRPAGLRPARPGQPARHPRAQPRVAVLPHPRHQRHPQDRPAVVVGLHRAVQRAHPRGLRPRQDRHAGSADMTARRRDAALGCATGARQADARRRRWSRPPSRESPVLP